MECTELPLPLGYLGEPKDEKSSKTSSSPLNSSWTEDFLARQLKSDEALEVLEWRRPLAAPDEELVVRCMFELSECMLDMGFM